MLDFEHARALMVERQIEHRGVREEKVLAAMREVPRELFVPEALREFAYEDSPLPIDEAQTISQPFIVAAMIEAAELEPGERVLEIGAGSGYAAAVMSRIAGEVIAIERHEALAKVARRRLVEAGYGNVEIIQGDGSKGCPSRAPFDAIIVSAGGPAIPQTLKEQLDIGGRLVMPVGDSPRSQRLIKVTRQDARHFEEEDLGGVAFVPLIGAHGWTETEDSPARQPGPPSTLATRMAAAAEDLPELKDARFADAFDRFAAARVVLLGEASHGTSEFYRARAAITRRLVERHGFNIVALEADWPDAASIDRYVRQRPTPANTEPPFRRFPTWMWRNTDFDAFVQSLRTLNEGRPAEQRAGVYGLDLYSLSSSIEAVLGYLDKVDPDAAKVARQRYGCLMPYANEPQTYGRVALSRGYSQCEAGVVKMLRELMGKRLAYEAHDGESFIDAAANARLVKNAEAYYRAMYYGAAESWNLRDTHMFETLTALLEAKGPEAKAVLWAHNSHIGDASKTEMGQVREELNLGQLCRERFGDKAALIGFGTHTGTVACADDWDEPMQVKRVLPSRADSYERVAHEGGKARFLLDLRAGRNEALREELAEPMLERFIGVIYRPETERWSHYTSCQLSEQFDAYVWFDETTAVTPLPTAVKPGVDGTYPFGL